MKYRFIYRILYISDLINGWYKGSSSLHGDSYCGIDATRNGYGNGSLYLYGKSEFCLRLRLSEKVLTIYIFMNPSLYASWVPEWEDSSEYKYTETMQTYVKLSILFNILYIMYLLTTWVGDRWEKPE